MRWRCILGAASAAALLAGTSAAADGAVDWSRAETLDVQLRSFEFSPNQIQLRAGAAYRLRLINNTSGGHDFASSGLFAAVRLAPEDAALVKDGEVDVPKQSTVELRFVAETPGTYKLKCTHFMHAAMGMTGTATIG